MSGFQLDKEGFFIVSTPSDTRDYQIDWSNVLNVGETISASTWGVPVGLVSGATAFTATIATQRIGGGRVNTVHRIDNTITTSAGLVYKRGFRLFVKINL